MFSFLDDKYDEVAGPLVSPCWVWRMGQSGRYGRIRVGNVLWYVHRYVLMVKLGRELEEGELATHRCDNTKCCNPDHIFLGTTSTNVQECYDRERHPPVRILGEANGGGGKLNEDAVRLIRSSTDSTLVMAERFGISRSMVSKIRLRQVWSHVV